MFDIDSSRGEAVKGERTTCRFDGEKWVDMGIDTGISEEGYAVMNERLTEALNLATKASPALLSEEYLCKTDEISGPRRLVSTEFKQGETK